MKPVHRGFTIIELLVVVTVIGILIGILLPVLSTTRETARLAVCRTNIGQVGKAALQYEVLHQRLPPGWLGPQPPAEIGNSQEPFIGTLYYLLPHLQLQHLTEGLAVEKNVRKSGPPWWKDKAIVKAAKHDVPTFHCPSADLDPPDLGMFLTITTWHDPDEHLYWISGAYVSTANNGDELGSTNYLGCMGYVGRVDHPPGDAWRGAFYNRSLESTATARKDGASNTILFGEALGHDRGRGVQFSWIGCGALPTAWGIDNDHFANFSSEHGDQVVCCLMDGSVKGISKEVSKDTLISVGGIDDGRVVVVGDSIRD